MCVCAGLYKLVASGPSGTAEKELQLIVVPEGDEEEEVTDKVDLTPIPVDGFGAYVTEQHANGNKKFASNYSVGLINTCVDSTSVLMCCVDSLLHTSLYIILTLYTLHRVSVVRKVNTQQQLPNSTRRKIDLETFLCVSS